MDPAFWPRPLLWVDALPRNAQGKLPKAELLALAKKALQGFAAGETPSKGVLRTMDVRFD
jgi:acyl-coenzyme A synthetase/AMP-(fatty) acid ligase